jgi:agmatinase
MENFNPDGTGVENGNYFGLPWAADDAELVLMSVPWDVTSSYGDGAAGAPEAIVAASTQLDLHDPVSPDAWRRGIGTLPIDLNIKESSALLRDDASRVMRCLEKGEAPDPELVERVNRGSEWLNGHVYDIAREWLNKGRLVGLVGGDHSTPYGLIRAVSEREGTFSVLHIDAHADLRDAYEGFRHSHASIMFNVLKDIPQVERLVQVAVRDQCDCESVLAAKYPRIEQFGDWELAKNEFRGMPWDEQCGRIIEQLGEKVYISFDIDGLSPEFAPGTGTPVPGGVSFNKAVYLLDAVVSSGRRVVGFDLCEVAPRKNDEWDANVGARVLWKLCGMALRTK